MYGCCQVTVVTSRRKEKTEELTNVNKYGI